MHACYAYHYIDLHVKNKLHVGLEESNSNLPSYRTLNNMILSYNTSFVCMNHETKWSKTPSTSVRPIHRIIV